MTAGNNESHSGHDPGRSGAAGRPGDEIDLLAYVETCWRYRYVLLALVLLTGAVTWLVNLRLAPTYEVVFRLMASEPRVGGEPAREESVVQYREFVESQTIAAGLLEEFGLNAPPHNLTPRSFLDDHVAVEIIRDSTIVRVAVRLKDRELLVRLAQRYAERVVEVAQRLNTEGLDYTTEQIRRQRDAALERLSEAEEALRAYQQQGRERDQGERGQQEVGGARHQAAASTARPSGCHAAAPSRAMSVFEARTIATTVHRWGLR